MIIENSCKEKKIQIWTGKKDKHQKKIDFDATKLFLNILETHWPKLSDDKTQKSEVWDLVGDNLKQMGYSLGENPGIKSKNKWSNMIKAYKKFVAQTQATGSGVEVLDDPPLFMEDIQRILGEAHGIHPTYTGDSMKESQTPKLLSKFFF